MVSVRPRWHAAYQRPYWWSRPLLRRSSSPSPLPLLPSSPSRSLLLPSSRSTALSRVAYISILGKPYKGSIYEQNSWLNVGAYHAMTISAYHMRDRSQWLDYADHAIDLVPKLMPCLFKVTSVPQLFHLLFQLSYCLLTYYKGI